MAGIKLDTREVENGIKNVASLIMKNSRAAESMVAEEIIRLSNSEVPKGDTRELQNSATVEQSGDETLVGYNIVYAAYQHEGHRADGTRIIRSYREGKGKFMEDPIRNNLSVFKAILERGIF